MGAPEASMKAIGAPGCPGCTMGDMGACCAKGVWGNIMAAQCVWGGGGEEQGRKGQGWQHSSGEGGGVIEHWLGEVCAWAVHRLEAKCMLRTPRPQIYL